MKKNNLIIILAFISSFYSCDKDNDDTETKKYSQNGYTLNSEFFSTNELILTGLTPAMVGFFILDDTDVFNNTTGEFEGNSGRGIFLFIGLDEDASGPMDLVGTYTNVVEAVEIHMDGDFTGGQFKDIESIESLLGSNINTGNYLPVDAGDVRVGFDSETETFTIEYTLTSNQGTITGSYEGTFQLYELKDDSQ